MRIDIGKVRHERRGRVTVLPRVTLTLGFLWDTGNYGALLLWRLRELDTVAQGERVYGRSWRWIYATQEFAQDHGRWWWLLALVPLTIHRIENRSASRAWTGRSSEFVLCWWRTRDHWRLRTRMVLV